MIVSKGVFMSKLHYVGPRVEISHKGITYKNAKEDKYVYLMSALEILKALDNDYEQKPSYAHHFSYTQFEDEHLHNVLQEHEYDLEECISDECNKYINKIDHKIDYIRSIPHLTDTEKDVWVKNIEIMKDYQIQRAMNKMYYMHCIHDIVHVIQHKRIKEVSAPFNKNFFHVLNTIKGALITGKPSLDAKVIKQNDKNGNMVAKLMIR